MELGLTFVLTLFLISVVVEVEGFLYSHESPVSEPSNARDFYFQKDTLVSKDCFIVYDCHSL